MKLRIFFTLAFCSLLTGQKSQFSIGISSYYGKGVTPIQQFGQSQFYDYKYSEHFIDVTGWRGDWTLWTSLELSSPPRIGTSFAGLRKLRLSRESGPYTIMVGDLYGQIGRGLGLNLWENQAMDWDSSLRGAWVSGRPREKVKIDLIAGKATGGRHLGAGPGIDPRIRDFEEDETVAALSGRMEQLLPGVNLGAYFMFINGNRQWFSVRRGEDLDTVKVASFKPGVIAEMSGGNFDLFFEAAVRSNTIKDVDSLYSVTASKWYPYESEQFGRGLYFSGSYFPGQWGVTVELKDYFFDTSSPEKRVHLPFRLGRSSLVYGPPSGFKEHSSTLLSRTPHIMDADDEVGFQIEFNRQVNEELFLVVNYARSSRHSAFEKEVDEQYGSTWKQNDHIQLFVPTTDYGFYPFQEGYAEVNYRYGQVMFTSGLSHSSEVMLYSAQNAYRAGSSGWESEHSKLSEFFERRNLISIPSELTLGLPRGFNITLDVEHQWEALELGTRVSYTPHGESSSDSVKAVDLEAVPYYYRYVALNVGKASLFNVGFLFDHASKTKTGDLFNFDPKEDNWLEETLRNNEVDITNKWFGVQGSLYVTPSTVLSMFYGSIQGGLKCDSGICVYVPGIDDAFTLSFTANF